jgi:transposase-like protein
MFFSDSDYNCPFCGWEMDYSRVGHDVNDPYSYVCPECGKHFETPDV